MDTPVRFPATFTFVLRAFSTLEGVGKTLDEDYIFSKVRFSRLYNTMWFWVLAVSSELTA